MNVFVWVLFGIVIGIVTNALDPHPAEGKIFGTVLLGVVGSLLGSTLATILFNATVPEINFLSFIIATCSAFLLLFIGRVLVGNDR